MMLKDCIKHMPSTGVCSIDLKKIVKLFDKKCFVSRWGKEYQLIRSGCFKITISDKDAMFLICELDLEKHDSPLFTKGSTYIKKVTEKG